MRIEQQVCSYEQAIRLRELGIEQKAYFWYFHPIGTTMRVVWPYSSPGHVLNGCEQRSCNVAAFNCAELGNILKHHVERISFQGLSNYLIYEKGLDTIFYSQPTEAEARATLLIFFIEKGFITSDEVNQRLNPQTATV
jgi:hypothetical protein